MKALPLKNNLKALHRVNNASGTRKGYLRLDKNENIAPFPEQLMKQLRRELTSEFLTRYPEVDPLYTRLAQISGCRRDNIYLTAGSDAAIKAVFEAFVEPRDKVILISPSYAMFYVYAKMFRARLHEIHYSSELKLSVDDIVKTIRRVRPKLVCVANPNSPTGTVISPKGIRQIIVAARNVNAIMLVDEAYYMFYRRSAAKHIRDFPNLVVTRTFSKAYGLASARLGYAIGSHQMMDCLHKTRPMYETNAFAVRFGLIMLDNKRLVEKMIRDLKKGKTYLEKFLKEQRIPFYPAYANFILMDVGFPARAVKIAERLKSRNILVKAGFSEVPLNRCVRANFGNVSQMKIFARAFLREFKKYGS